MPLKIDGNPMPVGHRILVAVDEVEKKVGLIEMPDAVHEREQLSKATGTIVAIGEDAWADKPSRWAEVGDHVIFAQFSGCDFLIHDKPHRFINDLDIYGVISREVN